jgi:hypothetical protein
MLQFSTDNKLMNFLENNVKVTADLNPEDFDYLKFK